MIYAIDNLGNRIRAYPKASAFCPLCGSVVKAKCGELRIWHWAHVSKYACDSFAETETEWHRRWKQLFEQHGAELEVVLEHQGEKHRADVYLPNHRVIVELQHSPIRFGEVQKRAEFYELFGRLVWVFDANLWSIELTNRETYTSFRWKYARRSLFQAFENPPVFLDLGKSGVLKVKKLYTDARVSGWGYMRQSAKSVARRICQNASEVYW